MEKQIINIRDFDLFIESLKPVCKITDSIKIDIDQYGVRIGAKNTACRCEIRTNALYSDNPVSMCFLDVNNFARLMGSIATANNNDYSGVNMFVEDSFLKSESKKLKLKITMTTEDTIASKIDQGFRNDMTLIPSDYEFITNSDYIKRLNNHTYMFSDPNSIRVYLRSEKDMTNNTIHATLGTEDNDFENSITFEFGMLTSGNIGDSTIILDTTRLNMLNIVNSEEIKVKKPTGRNSLIAFISKVGGNDSYMNVTMIDTILVK